MWNNNLPQRKPLRLEGYDYSSCGAYFVTICVEKKHCILGTIVQNQYDNSYFTELSPYGKTAEKYIRGIQGIEQYIIMPNHIHMIICIDENANQSIPQLVKSFKILVSKEIGFGVFQRSYYDHIIRNTEEYEKIVKYIYENPMKWREDELFFESMNLSVF